MQIMQQKDLMLCVFAVCLVTITLLQYYSYTIRSIRDQTQMFEKETILHFFLHDTPGGSKPSAIKVLHANETVKDTSQTPFGTMWVVDDPLTVGPERGSTVIGNARGVYVSAGQNELMLVAYLDFGFTSGEFSGSSISMFSRNPVEEIEREFAVVGGLGKFRMARGFANLKCIFYNQSNGDSIVEYTVVIKHY